ncbi:MAG: GAF domain-containing protein, partial [Caldilineae bacterium]
METMTDVSLLETVRRIGLAQTPQELLESLGETPILRRASRSTIILFHPDLPEREAIVVAAVDNRPNAVEWVGTTYHPHTIPLFWDLDPAEPFVVEDTHTDDRLPEYARNVLDHLNIRALVAFALTAAQTHLGWLLVENETPQTYPPDDLALLQTLTRHVSVTLYNQHLLQKTQTALQETQILLDASRELFTAASLTDVYNVMCRAFLAAGADRCTLSTFTDFGADGLPTHSQIAALHTQNEDDLRDRLGKTYDLTRYPYLSQGLVTRDLLILTDIADHPHLNDRERRYLTRIGAQTVVIVPLFAFSSGEPLGYLFVEYLQPHPFSDRELTLFRTIGNHAILAIETARQQERTRQRARQLQTGAEISKITSRILEQETLFQQAVNLIQEGFDFYYVGLFLVDEKEQYAVLQAGSGEAGRAQVEAGHKLALDEQSMIGWSILHRQPRVAFDVGEDAVHFQNPYLPDTRSEMALPLISQEEVLGALTIQSEKPAAFSEDDIVSLQIMADQLANAILNSRLYERTRRRAEELNTLLQINRELFTTPHLDDLLHRITDRATHIVNGDHGTLFIAEGGLLVPRAVVGGYTKEMLAIRVKMGEGATGTAAQTRRTVVRVIEQPAAAQNVNVPGTPIVPETVIAVPVQTEANLIGVLLIRRLDVARPFTPAEVELLEGMALQAAIAVENANLLAATQKARQETETLYHISRELAATDSIPEAANILIRHAAKDRFDRLVIALQDAPDDPENTWVEVVSVWDADGQEDRFLGNRFSAEQIPLIKASLPDDYLLINDFADHPLVDEQTR